MGAEALRDILSFMAAGDQRFRIVDMRHAYTASSRRGFRREEDTTETVPLHRFGDVTVNGVPFFVMDPGRSPNGTNLIALKGGPGTGNASDEFAQRVEIPLNGVGREPALPRRRWRVGMAGRRRCRTRQAGDEGRRAVRRRQLQRSTCSKNGRQFADALVRADVPLSAMPATSPAAASCATSPSISRRRPPCRRSRWRATTATSCR